MVLKTSERPEALVNRRILLYHVQRVSTRTTYSALELQDLIVSFAGLAVLGVCNGVGQAP